MVKKYIKIKNSKQEKQSKRKYIIINQAPQNNLNYIIQESFLIIQNYLNKLLSINSKNEIEDKDIQNSLDNLKQIEKEAIPVHIKEDDICKNLIKIFCPKTNNDEFEENGGGKSENDLGEVNIEETLNKINNRINIFDYLNQKIFLMEKFQEKLSNKTMDNNLVDLNQIKAKIYEVNSCLNTLLLTIGNLFNNTNNSTKLYAEYFFKYLFRQQKENKIKYEKETEELKQEIINARKVFTPSELSQITYIPKKNANNWIKNGVKRKVGCGKKKMLLPLRQAVGLYLKREMERGIKYKRHEIKEIVRKKGIELIYKGFIDEKEFNKFTISFSWIKQLLKEYNI